MTDTTQTDAPVTAQEVTLNDAMRSYRRIAFLEQQYAQEVAYVEAEKQRLDAYLAQRREATFGKIGWHKQKLVSFWSLFHRRNPRDKSYPMPGGGRVGQRTKPEQIVKVLTDDAVVAELDAKGVPTDGLVATKRVLQWATLKERLGVIRDADGQIMRDEQGNPFIGVAVDDGVVVLDGFAYQPETNEFYVKVGDVLVATPPESLDMDTDDADGDAE